MVEHVQQPNQYPNWHAITNFKLYVILQRTYHQTFLTNLNRIGRWRTTAAARWMVARHIAPIHHLIRTPCEWKLFVVLRKNGLHKFNEHRSIRIAEKEWITNLKKKISFASNFLCHRIQFDENKNLCSIKKGLEYPMDSCQFFHIQERRNIILSAFYIKNANKSNNFIER